MKAQEEEGKGLHVYLDANILYPFSITLQHPLFQILLEMAKSWDFDINIPELAYLEWLNKKREDIEVSVNKLTNSYNYLAANYEVDKVDVSNISSTEMFDKSKAVVREHLSKMNVNIIESCAVDTRKLIDMSLKNVRPFEERGEKGFRDTIILFTILGHAKSKGSPCFFISNDRVYVHPDVKKVAKEDGVDIYIYNSIEEFKERMESLRLKIVERFRNEKLKKLEEFLKTRREQIAEFIKQEGKFSITTLNMLFEKQAPEYAFLLSMLHEPPPPIVTPSVIKINKIELLDITAHSLPVEREPGLVPVYFWVKLNFLVSVERTYSPLYWYDRRLGLSGEERVGRELSEKRELSEEYLEGEFPIYADLKSEGDEYTDLVLKQVGENRLPSLGKSLFKKEPEKG